MKESQKVSVCALDTEASGARMMEAKALRLDWLLLTSCDVGQVTLLLSVHASSSVKWNGKGWPHQVTESLHVKFITVPSYIISFNLPWNRDDYKRMKLRGVKTLVQRSHSQEQTQTQVSEPPVCLQKLVTTTQTWWVCPETEEQGERCWWWDMTQGSVLRRQRLHFTEEQRAALFKNIFSYFQEYLHFIYFKCLGTADCSTFKAGWGWGREPQWLFPGPRYFPF